MSCTLIYLKMYFTLLIILAKNYQQLIYCKMSPVIPRFRDQNCSLHFVSVKFSDVSLNVVNISWKFVK